MHVKEELDNSVLLNPKKPRFYLSCLLGTSHLELSVVKRSFALPTQTDKHLMLN